MRTVATDLLAEFQSPSDRIAFAILIRRDDGTQIARTSADIDCVLTGIPIAGSATGAVTFESMPGLNCSSIVSTVGLGVDNFEGTLLEDDEVLAADIYAGFWRAAHWSLVAFNFAAPADGFVHLKSGRLANKTLKNGAKVFELRDYRQAAQHDTSRRTSPTCDWEYGSTSLPAGLCFIDLGPRTHAGTVTGVTNTRQFTVSGFAQAAEYFTNGVMTWLTGDNAGLDVRIRSHPGSGVLVLDVQMVRAIQVGDTLSAIKGCRKRFAEDCRDENLNARQFGGFHEKPQSSKQVNPIVEPTS